MMHVVSWLLSRSTRGPVVVQGSRYTVTKRTWLVTVAVRGQEAVSGLDAEVLLRASNLGGMILSHGFGPGAVDLELRVVARTAAEACKTIRQRVAHVLGPDWQIEVLASEAHADIAN